MSYGKSVRDDLREPARQLRRANPRSTAGSLNCTTQRWRRERSAPWTRS
jgi:hypothetical protein